MGVALLTTHWTPRSIQKCACSGVTPSVPDILPASWVCLTKLSMVDTTSGCVICPGYPMFSDRSPGPKNMQSAPLVFIISLAFCMLSGVSICKHTKVSSLACLTYSAWSWTPNIALRPENPPRLPMGGYFTESTTLFACSALFMRGIITPCAPPSRYRCMCCWSFIPIRMIGVVFESSAARIMFSVVS